MKKTVLFMVFTVFLGASGARALELSLEENKAESGTIGYVDISQVFKKFSGTSDAREEFLAEIKKKEDSLNLKKQAIFSLKADIAALRQGREFALTLPGLMRLEREIATAPAKIAASTEPLISTTTPLPLTGPDGGARTGEAVAETTSPISVPAEVAAATSAVSVPAEVAATPPAPSLPAGLPGMPGIDMPGISRVPMNYFKFSVSTSVADIDSALTLRQTELEKKQEDLRQSRTRTERELLEYEAHKSEMILGRIYMTLKELAIASGVSVVVDKKNILFGHSAVDLTDTLIRKLEENPI